MHTLVNDLQDSASIKNKRNSCFFYDRQFFFSFLDYDDKSIYSALTKFQFDEHFPINFNVTDIPKDTRRNFDMILFFKLAVTGI